MRVPVNSARRFVTRTLYVIQKNLSVNLFLRRHELANSFLLKAASKDLS